MVLNFIMDIIFGHGVIFDKFRNFIHNGFKEQKNLIRNHFNLNKKTLDFGCGVAPFSTLFNPQTYYGVDTDSKYIEFCKSKHKGNFLLIKNSPQYQFTNNYFDQIFLSAVTHHLDDNTFRSIFNEFYRILSKNGKLMIIDSLPLKKQNNLFCKFLIMLDRGHHFRDSYSIINLLSYSFKIEKQVFFKNGPYSMYMLIFVKKI